VKIAVFCQSLASDWNHGNAHFLRGLMRALRQRGHDAVAFEAHDNWSRANLVRDHGPDAARAFREAYPELPVVRYAADDADLDALLDGVEVVLAHEWGVTPGLLDALLDHRDRHGTRVLFHDTHHRSVTAPHGLDALPLHRCDGVLAFGRVVAERYRAHGWNDRVWVWHEAADVSHFVPRLDVPVSADLVWIGNWGDDERTDELHEFLIEPVRRLGLRATVFGVRYPDAALRTLADAGITYGGYLPNHGVPEVFAAHRVTVHVPRRPYVRALPGVPTIRPFEALACGIPLVCAPWDDAERLFHPGRDFLTARDGRDMERQLACVLQNPAVAVELAAHGRHTVLRRHTCGHRADELLAILAGLGVGAGLTPTGLTSSTP
jgi:spore maturation protein CgeB